ncbi:efflux transporter periplasmic adaptor subunit [Methylovorus sp. MM2]|uniref:efflux RND transporter periplasmic adaptor subunit n=1 Tax=Methylovorus sp. MM2 TaxID=1848038 RepID=UPI0007DF1456|nr:efflux RND transporter periplasmic adaptor subunit [Methylovorus sp. MM2]OAM52769.1 efflux transporter periplasmic adaptor subunit [Methylovorus sp. MM2]
MKRSTKKTITLITLLAIAGGGFYYYKESHKPKPEDLYRLQKVTQGSVEQTVSANGTLNPVTVVSVGAQVSGRVSKLYVDFNDEVKAGQVLLELDDSLFTAQIAQSEGNVRNAQASVDLAKASEARIRSLYTQEYVSKQELDQAVQALQSAQAQVDTYKAQLRRDKTNLSYSIIRSPISGVVVDRVVNLGQTVAASFQTPTLIQIAQDLSKMQINSSFAEADIGNIKVGQKAKFTVDAFPNKNFEGLVKQVRLNPTVTSNVVTYDVVVTVDNPGQILLPGMTAYVNITVAKHDDVMLVPNAALRYKPKVDDSDANQNTKVASGSGDKPNPNGQTNAGGDQQAGGQKGGRERGGKRRGKNEDLSAGKVYVLNNGKPEEVKVRLGISDGRFTEIKSRHLEPDAKIIVGETLADNQPQTQGPGNNMRMRMF